MKIIKLAFTVCLITGILYYLYQWQSPYYPELSPNSLQDSYDMIHKNPHRTFTQITSMGNNFDIYYVKSIQPTDPYAFAHYFPAIHMIASESCNAWLQVVTTDNIIQPQYQRFIDSVPKDDSRYPFYTTERNFYDFPQWTYSFFTKPVNIWKAHAWAIHVNNDNKTIKCLGGISWGYRLPQFSFKPSMILPEPLSKQNWQKDWEEMYQPIFKDYRDITP